ncbi:rhomboid-related protein 1-like isoform X2 [Palaemon carinicauda]|uniref:rhomboid-related protein 1-like isoform X2 n=1 Tax=Palaemon carinicauda TaxID=392227 RepID=UPI0035B5DED7
MEIHMDEADFFRSRDDRPSRRQLLPPMKAPTDLVDWQDVWYRFDNGRGQIAISAIAERIPRTTNNTQAVLRALKLLNEADPGGTGYVTYKDFEHFYNNILPDNSWERGVLVRAALDVVDEGPEPLEEPYFNTWMQLVSYVHSKPSYYDFNWHRILPYSYNRNRLLHYVFYRSELVHPARLKEWIYHAKEADTLPNAVAIQLLGKAEIPFQEADINQDGFLEYEEFLRFVKLSNAARTRSTVLRRGALAVIPRAERTLETRRYIEEYSCCPPPLCMLVITLVELVMFIYYAIDMNSLLDMTILVGPRGPCPLYSPLVYNPARRYEAWRYISYALIHSGWVHLVNNLIVQVVLGVLLELVHKWWRVLLIYLSGVVLGAVLHSLFTPGSYLAGASGGVYAVEYAHLGNLFLNWSEMEANWAQLIVMLIIISLDFGYAFWDTYLAATPSHTGHMAHFGGALAGVLVGVFVLRNLRKEKWERIFQWISIAVFFAVVIVGIILNCTLPSPQYYPENDYTSFDKLKNDWKLMMNQ